VEPEPKQLLMAGAGAKIFQMVEPEPEIWVPVQASYTNYAMFFLFLNQIVLEPEPKI